MNDATQPAEELGAIGREEALGPHMLAYWRIWFEQALLFNQISQGARSLEDGLARLAALKPAERAIFWDCLVIVTDQAGGGRYDHLRNASRESPSSQAEREAGRRQEATRRAGALDERDEAAFRWVIARFCAADRQRRETVCRGGCNHWWHRDLADPGVVAEVVFERSRFGFSLRA
jgi:hypothetical protein